MITVFGLRNCDRCRKARRWLDDRGVDHRFHDLRRDGLEAAMVAAWMEAVGGAELINRRGSSWRALSADERAHADDASLARLALAEPALIKRPVVAWGRGVVTVGFEPDRWSDLLQ